jgi:hypothetical protein
MFDILMCCIIRKPSHVIVITCLLLGHFQQYFSYIMAVSFIGGGNTFTYMSHFYLDSHSFLFLNSFLTSSTKSFKYGKSCNVKHHKLGLADCCLTQKIYSLKDIWIFRYSNKKMITLVASPLSCLKHTALRRKPKDGLGWNQDNVSA